MAQKSTLETVQEIIHNAVGVDVETIKPESRFAEDLETDSLDRMEITMLIEEEFDIELPDEEADKLFTVAQVVEVIDSKLEARK